MKSEDDSEISYTVHLLIDAYTILTQIMTDYLCSLSIDTLCIINGLMLKIFHQNGVLSGGKKGKTAGERQLGSHSFTPAYFNFGIEFAVWFFWFVQNSNISYQRFQGEGMRI